MAEVRVLNLKEAPDYRSAFLRLVQEIFPRGAPVSGPVGIEQEFSLLLHPENAAHNLFVIEIDDSTAPGNKRILAAASFRVFEFKLQNTPQVLKCAGIGLVVTDPEHQKKGYGHLIQAEIEKRAAEIGCLFTLLWSDLVQFYTRLGYLVAGTELQWQLDMNDLSLLAARLEAEVNPKTPIEIRPIKKFSEVASFYQWTGVGPTRDSEIYTPLLELPNTWAFAAYSHERSSPQLLAYGIMGKGRDLRDTIHELMGEKRAIGLLLKAFVKNSQAGLRVQQPLGSPLQQELEHWLGPATKAAMAFFKVLRGPELVDWIASSGIMPSGIGISRVPQGFSIRNRHITFFESQDFGHLLQLFFGPWNIEELEDLPPDFQSQLAGARTPIPLYFWGLDSV